MRGHPKRPQSLLDYRKNSHSTILDDLCRPISDSYKWKNDQPTHKIGFALIQRDKTRGTNVYKEQCQSDKTAA